MKYLETKHERNSAKITTLLVLIITLLCFVVGQDYKELPEEYGVALDFGNAAPAGGKASPIQSNVPEEAESKEILEEEVPEEEVVEEEVLEEEVVEEETNEEEQLEEERLEKEALEQEKIEEEKAAEKAAEEAAAIAEKLLAQQEEEALRIKTEQEAAEAAEAKKAKAAKEAKEKADKAATAKKAADAKAKAAKAAKEAKAKASAAAAAKKAAADKAAKAKAIADGKAAADTKAKSDAAAVAAKAKQAGNGETGFSLNEIAPIYPGCSGGDNDAKNKCMREKIQQFIAKNYNTEVASDLSGVQKIRIFLNIDKAGNFVGINAKASDPKLEVETKRVTALLPKVKPAMQQGKPVKTRFQLAINIEIK